MYKRNLNLITKAEHIIISLDENQYAYLSAGTRVVSILSSNSLIMEATMGAWSGARAVMSVCRALRPGSMDSWINWSPMTEGWGLRIKPTDNIKLSLIISI